MSGRDGQQHPDASDCALRLGGAVLAGFAGMDSVLRAAVDFQKLQLRIGEDNARMLRETCATTGWQLSLLAEMWDDAVNCAARRDAGEDGARWLFRAAVRFREWPYLLDSVLFAYPPEAAGGDDG